MRLAILAAAAICLWWPLHVFLGSNVHEVLPNKIYRGAQPDRAGLRGLIQRHGIRTILNLRGVCYPQDWYVEEASLAQDMGVSLEDVCFSAGRMPSRHELRLLVQVLDDAEYPMFVHCRQGADRTGLACAIALLLQTDLPYTQALRQLGPRYGHIPLGKTANLDEFFNQYERWLQEQNRAHEPKALRHWLLEEYRGGACQMLVREATPLQPAFRVGQPLAWRVQLVNTSSQPWHFKPTMTAGFHVGFLAFDGEGKLAAGGRAGMFAKDVPPGESIAVTVVVPPLAKPGKHTILIDMVEEGHCWFYQTGSEPYVEEIHVHQ